MNSKNISGTAVLVTLLLTSIALKEPVFTAGKMNPYAVYGVSHFVTAHNREKLMQVASFELTAHDIKDMGREMTKIQFKKKEYFLALASQAEGFKSAIYHDNKGFAFGTGWNLTKQSMQYNKELAKAVFPDNQSIEIIANMSAQSGKLVSSKEKEHVFISPQKSMQVAYLMSENIKQEIVLKKMAQFIQETKKLSQVKAEKMAKHVFQRLKINQQDALVYHAYKVGPSGFLKYRRLLTSIVEAHPQNALKEFNYTYQLDNKTYEDKQATQLVSAMFKSPQEFAKLVNIKSAKEQKF